MVFAGHTVMVCPKRAIIKHPPVAYWPRQLEIVEFKEAASADELVDFLAKHKR